MKTININLLSFAILSVVLTGCPSKSEIEFPINAIDNESTTFLDGAQFTSGIEGPAVDKNNNLYVVNFGSEGTIGKIDQDGMVSTFLTLPNGSVGNGIRFYNSNMFIADYKGHNIFKASKEGVIEVYAHNPTMNQPNDLAVSHYGQLFCSDPNWNEKTGKIWTVSPENQILVELKSGLGTTNGIELSPNDKYLYVNESNTLQVKRFEIDWNTNPITLSEPTTIHEFTDGGVDGMRCDEAGNIYIARITSQEVAILSPNGLLIKTVKLIGSNPTNVAFGGLDGKTVYVTVKDTKNIEKFRSYAPGRSFSIQ